jgi:hypothetical protein
VAGVFCILFVCGLLYPKSVVDDLRAERDAYRAAVSAERDRADAAVAAAQATRDVLGAIQAGVTLGHQHQAQARYPALGEGSPT